MGTDLDRARHRVCGGMNMSSGADHEAVKRSYDEVAEDYWANIGGELSHKPLDRALLRVLLEGTEPDLEIADLGCGPGHVAAWLATRGARVVGIDLSGAMIALARNKHPAVEFREGDLLALPAAEGEFGAALALYSIIHLEAFELRAAFEEIRRTLKPSGLCLVSFHLGTEVRHRSEWWGHQVDLDFRFLAAESVIEAMEGAGFSVEAKLERANYPEEVATTRAYLLARRA